MQLANALVALGGNKGNTVPKDRITAAEIAVLMAIHGSDAVHDIEPLDDEIDVSYREELARLIQSYPARDEDNQLIVRQVYPGAAPALHETIADLQLDESLFKVSARIAPKAPPKKAARKPRPAAATARVENDADSMFDDDAEAADEAADVLK